MNEILKAKKELYSLLLQRSEAELSDSDVEIMYRLSKDPGIQSHLKEIGSIESKILPSKWKSEYYPIPANHENLLKSTRESLIAAIDHSIKKWTGLVNIEKYDINLTDGYYIMGRIETAIGLYIDGNSCALCQRFKSENKGLYCKLCPLYYTQGAECGTRSEDAYTKAVDALSLGIFIEAAKLMVAKLEDARVLALNSNFPCKTIEELPYGWNSLPKKDVALLTDLVNPKRLNRNEI